ncbi:hydrogenase 3 maturation endopeptidase HyCI [Candidatus Latescibacterota bacterium]
MRKNGDNSGQISIHTRITNSAAVRTKENRMAQVDGNVVIVAIGNELRGDDGAGILFGKLLSGDKSINIINAGDAPENYTEVITGRRPDTILIADAMDYGGNPGDVMLVPGDRLAKESSSTHGSLRLFVDFLGKISSAKIFVLGFQPKSIALGDDISPEVYESVKKTADNIIAGESISQTVSLMSSEYC